MREHDHMLRRLDEKWKEKSKATKKWPSIKLARLPDFQIFCFLSGFKFKNGKQGRMKHDLFSFTSVTSKKNFAGKKCIVQGKNIAKKDQKISNRQGLNNHWVPVNLRWIRSWIGWTDYAPTWKYCAPSINHRQAWRSHRWRGRCEWALRIYETVRKCR